MRWERDVTDTGTAFASFRRDLRCCCVLCAGPLVGKVVGGWCFNQCAFGIYIGVSGHCPASISPLKKKKACQTLTMSSRTPLSESDNQK